MANLGNPFKPGSGLSPPYLAGRDADMRTFSQMLQSIEYGTPANMMIYGIRGVGKTVLLLQLAKICLNNGFLPITRLQYDCGFSDPKIFLKALQFDLDQAVEAASKTDRFKKKAKKIGNYVKPKTVGIPGFLSYEPAHGSSSDVVLGDQMVDYLTKAWNRLQKNKPTGIVFLFDEFHNIKDKTNEHAVLASFLGTINTLQIQGIPYSLVLCGLPTMISNIKKSRSYSERMFGSILEITNLDEAAARDAILEPLKTSCWDFSDELTSAILHDSDGYPYFIQFICKAILDLIDPPHIGMEDYAPVRNSIMTNLGQSFFNQRMESLSNGQRNVLLAMASVKDSKVDFSSICENVDMGKATVHSHLRRLEEKGIIYKRERGMYRFSMPLFKRYLDKSLFEDSV